MCSSDLYVRFQTPRVRLRDAWDEGMPFRWLEDRGGALASAGSVELEEAIRHLRIGAAIYRAAMRDHNRQVAEELQRTGIPALAVDVGAFLDESGGFLLRARGMLTKLLAAAPPTRLREAVRAADDFLSLQAMEASYGLLALFSSPEGGSGRLRARLTELLRAEEEHRRHAGLLVVTEDQRANERLVTRAATLKKWVLAVLHLRVVKSRRTRVMQDLLFGIAAAVAMTFAVVLQLVALWTVGTPTSPQVGGTTLFAFVGLAVGGYILKDRMKDWLKDWFSAGMPEWLYDRRQSLRVESSGALVGAVEETVRLVRAKELPPEVQAMREIGEEGLFRGQREEEDVIHYRRSLEVGSPEAPYAAIDEILRLNVAPWLRRMDDPDRPLARLGDDGTVQRAPGRKTYRITLVTGWEGSQRNGHALTVSRDGVERIEPLEAR